jgi:hypothetical protein
MGPRDSQSAKLFHAIVTLGLAAAGCGGEAQSNDSATKSDGGVQTSTNQDASGEGADASPGASADAIDANLAPPSDATTYDAAAPDAPDAGIDANYTDATAGNPIDADVAKDAAADVATQIWFVPPIK